jgi:hypothetical protein
MRGIAPFSTIFEFLSKKKIMKAKTISLAVICLLTSFAAYAQTSDAEAEAMANLLGVQKKGIIMKLISVSGKDSVTFWKIYDEYLQKNKALTKERIQLYEQTARSYNNMTAGTADSLARRYFSNRDVQEKSLEDYYQKVKTATNSVTAFEFYQAETYLLTQVRATIMQQIPTYGEYRNAIKLKN